MEKEMPDKFWISRDGDGDMVEIHMTLPEWRPKIRWWWSATNFTQDIKMITCLMLLGFAPKPGECWEITLTD